MNFFLSSSAERHAYWLPLLLLTLVGLTRVVEPYSKECALRVDTHALLIFDAPAAYKLPLAPDEMMPDPYRPFRSALRWFRYKDELHKHRGFSANYGNGSLSYDVESRKVKYRSMAVSRAKDGAPEFKALAAGSKFGAETHGGREQLERFIMQFFVKESSRSAQINDSYLYFVKGMELAMEDAEKEIPRDSKITVYLFSQFELLLKNPASPFYTSLKAQIDEWISKGHLIVLVAYGGWPSKETHFRTQTEEFKVVKKTEDDFYGFDDGLEDCRFEDACLEECRLEGCYWQKSEMGHVFCTRVLKQDLDPALVESCRKCQKVRRCSRHDTCDAQCSLLPWTEWSCDKKKCDHGLTKRTRKFTKYNDESTACHKHEHRKCDPAANMCPTLQPLYVATTSTAPPTESTATMKRRTAMVMPKPPAKKFPAWAMVAIGGACCMGLFLFLIGCWTCYISRSIRKRRHRRRQMREDAHRAHGDEARTMFSEYDEKRTRMLAASRLSGFGRKSAAPSVPTSKTSTAQSKKTPAKVKPSAESSGEMLRPTTALPPTPSTRPSTPAPKDVELPPPATKRAAQTIAKPTTKWMSATEPKESKASSTFAIQPSKMSKMGRSAAVNKQLTSAPITLPSAKTATDRMKK